MIQVLEHRTFFAVVGLPSSGTTVIANLFNSSKNTVCAMEPLLNEQLNGGGYKDETPETIIEHIAYDGERLRKDAYGIKETWSINHQLATNVLTSDFLDLAIFVFREPVSLYNSWTKHSGPQNPLSLFNNYQGFFDLFVNYKKKRRAIALIHERVCNEKLNYLNEKFSEWFWFDSTELDKQSFGMGNERANAGGKIELADMSRDLVPDAERQDVERYCTEIYRLAELY